MQIFGICTIECLVCNEQFFSLTITELHFLSVMRLQLVLVCLLINRVLHCIHDAKSERNESVGSDRFHLRRLIAYSQNPG